MGGIRVNVTLVTLTNISRDSGGRRRSWRSRNGADAAAASCVLRPCLGLMAQ